MKFLAFYRIIPEPPAPVIPIFTDGENTFRQICGSDDCVIDYKYTPDLSKDRLFISHELKINTPKNGDKAIYAYEYSKNSVAIGDVDTLRIRLKYLLKNDETLSGKYFSALDIANFTGDDELIKITAQNCFTSLGKISPSLSEKWLVGSQLSFTMKEYIAANSKKPSNKIEREYIFQAQCRKAVWKILERNAAYRGMSTQEYFDMCIETTMGSRQFHEVFSPNDVEKIRDILFSPRSKLLLGHIETTAKILLIARSHLGEDQPDSNRNLLDHLIIDQSQEDGLTKTRNYRVKTRNNVEKDVSRISKKFSVSKPEARGLMLGTILDKMDPEFISKVHAQIKSKSDRLNKNLEDNATKYFNRYIRYLPDLNR